MSTEPASPPPKLLLRLKSPGLAGWAAIGGIVSSGVAVVAFIGSTVDLSSDSQPAPSQRSAEAFSRHVIDQFVAGQWGELWDEMDPQVHSFLGRDLWVECNVSARPIAAPETIKLSTISTDTVEAPGFTDNPVQRLTYFVTAPTAKGETSAPYPAEVRVKEVGSEFRYVPTQPELDAYAAGSCPGSFGKPPASDHPSDPGDGGFAPSGDQVVP